MSDMVNAEDVDLMDTVGKHCFACKCNDFLPFQCDGCKRFFCAEHREYGHHDCPRPHANRNVTALVCSKCGESVRVEPGHDADESLARHVAACTEVPRARVPRCPVPGCKEKLTAVSSYTCASCRTVVCMKHRFAEDHACGSLHTVPQPRGKSFRIGVEESAPRHAPAAGTARDNVRGDVAATPSPAPAKAVPSVRDQVRRVWLQRFEEMLRPSARAASPTRPSPAQAEHFATPMGSPASPSRSGPSTPLDPELANADLSMLASTSRGPTPEQIRAFLRAQERARQPSKLQLLDGYEGCPWCGRSFADASELVWHSERCSHRPVQA